jgi:hypothetical protein
MYSSRYWSHESFEQAMEHFVPIIKANWMTHLKIIPINYSDWSDTLYITVEFDLTPEAEEDILAANYTTRESFTERIGMYIRVYFENLLNTKVGIKEFRRPANYYHK